ncbi:isochorismatase family protein [Jeotgalibacillus sp. R-1-5s-1]|uniref:isochorismatase family protein n=1 Tax=Jeotgalibacillus sp. R-1-5s-1 TaxID=2555897 RepID=UPI00106AC5CE|nr:isochorismatase family protein [Jeotgalibacillus sp. R-1-5s-1]TFD93606.1 isochorismatase family protein [Jeotgalibacillus sp. R-1-5s-1]
MKHALIVIDAQQELIEGNEQEAGIVNKELLIKNINFVIQKALGAESKIIFIRDKDLANGEGDGFEVHQDINIPQGAVKFEKYATNSFHGTPLLEYLKEQEIGHLVIAGCKTEHCIDTAVRTATINGFDVTLVGDAHSTSDSAALSGEQIIAHHNSTLHGHYNVEHFSLVRQSSEELFTPTHDEYR